MNAHKYLVIAHKEYYKTHFFLEDNIEGIFRKVELNNLKELEGRRDFVGKEEIECKLKK